MSKDLPSLDIQGMILARIFTSEVPDNDIVSLYSHIIKKKSNNILDPNDKKILSFAFRHPRLLPLVDAGLAIVKPDSELRRRTYTMFAVLEATPRYSEKFLAKQRSPLYIVVIGLAGIRAVFRALLGLVLVRIIQI